MKPTALFTAALLLIAGALLPLSLAPLHWWPAGVISAAVLAVMLRDATVKQAYWRSFQFSFAMFAVGASWVYVSMNTYGDTSAPMSVLLTAIFVTALALIFSLPFLLCGLFRNHSRTALLLGFPAIWVLAEWAIGWILTGFPWIYLGYGHLNSWLAGWAPVTGVWGISWITAFCSAYLALFITGRRWFDTTRIVALAVALLLWAGGYALQSARWTEPHRPLSVGLLQPNIPQLKRWDPDYLQSIIRSNIAMGESLWGNDLVIWPEAAIPELMHRELALLGQLDSLARDNNSTFITGIPVYTFENEQYHNSVIALGLGSGEYRKQHLVPIGEYVPMAEYIRGLIEFFDLPMSGFTPGAPDQPLLTAGDHKVATAICYEIAYPELVRQLTPDAGFILTVSNDTWFGDSLGPHQHLSMAQMRALENGRPVIRATNDGITALIDHRGRITDTLPQFTSGVLVGEITPRRGVTPYSHTGNWPVLILCLLCLGICSIKQRRD